MIRTILRKYLGDDYAKQEEFLRSFKQLTTIKPESSQREHPEIFNILDIHTENIEKVIQQLSSEDFRRLTF